MARASSGQMRERQRGGDYPRETRHEKPGQAGINSQAERRFGHLTCSNSSRQNPQFYGCSPRRESNATD